MLLTVITIILVLAAIYILGPIAASLVVGAFVVVLGAAAALVGGVIAGFAFITCWIWKWLRNK